MDALTQTINDSHRRSFIGGSDAQIKNGEDEGTPTRLGEEKLAGAEPRHPLGVPRPSQPERAGVGPAHAEFLAALAGQPPRPIPIDADPIDLEDRADHLNKVFGALSAYVAVIIDDTAQNVPGRLDLPDVEAVLADLASDVTGTIQHAAEGMGWGGEWSPLVLRAFGFPANRDNNREMHKQVF